MSTDHASGHFSSMGFAPSDFAPAGVPPMPACPIVLHLGPLRRMTDAEFFRFCQLNPDWRIERTHDGDLIVMPPASSDSGRRNFSLTAQLAAWSRSDGTGVGFDSSAGFRLPNGATRSPDAAWIERGRWLALSDDERQTFAPLTPDFVVELRSKTDSLGVLRAKMREYIDNGARLGWLIDPPARSVEVYRPGQEPVLFDQPATISAAPVLPGFVLDLTEIFE